MKICEDVPAPAFMVRKSVRLSQLAHRAAASLIRSFPQSHYSSLWEQQSFTKARVSGTGRSNPVIFAQSHHSSLWEQQSLTRLASRVPAEATQRIETLRVRKRWNLADHLSRVCRLGGQVWTTMSLALLAVNHQSLIRLNERSQAHEKFGLRDIYGYNRLVQTELIITTLFVQ